MSSNEQRKKFVGWLQGFGKKVTSDSEQQTQGNKMKTLMSREEWEFEHEEMKTRRYQNLFDADKRRRQLEEETKLDGWPKE